jgi:alkylation response protein AidB-like acyl-CoA dehydrogenase
VNFDDTDDEAAYRKEVRAWLEATAPRHQVDNQQSPEQRLAAARAWQGERAKAGFACITWPREWGGAGGTLVHRVIYDQEEVRYRVPALREFFEIGLGFCLPTVVKFAPEAQVQRFLPPAVRGDEIWCQLFSEPAAGSDLAGLRCSAVYEGDQWRINGQKVWTSGAHFSDFGLILTRTDTAVPKHKGLTMFWVDMRAPGIEVRPIRQMSGAQHFNEVYFTDVRIPDSQRLGDVGEGWKVSIVTLMNERVSGGGLAGPNVREVLALARELPSGSGHLVDDPAFRMRLADWHVRSQGLSLTRFRTMTAVSRGETPGPESSIGKLVAASEMLDMAQAAVEAQSEFGSIVDPTLSPMQGIFQYSLLHTPGLRIAGGTDEILRNIIAERVLGLPSDLRMDKDIPFKNLKSGR